MRLLCRFRVGLLFAVVVTIAGTGLSSRPANASAPLTWEQAHARERDALQAERDALAKSLRESRANTAATAATLRKEVEALSSQLTRLQVQNTQLEQDLPARERVRDDETEQRELDELLARMRARLSADDAERLGGDEPGDLPEIVRALLEAIEDESTLRTEQAEIFTSEGHLERASVLRIGQVAALAWPPPGAALVATPEGLREVEGVEPLAESHAEGVIARTVLQHPSEPPSLVAAHERSWSATMDAGGPIMWVLLLIGAIAGVIVIERTIGLIWAARRWQFEQRRFEQAVRRKETASLLDVGGWVAKPLVVAAAARCPSCSTELDTDVEERATQALMVMRERLQRRISLVNVTAGVAPLLGLLGTVTGMIHTFRVVTRAGTSDPQQLASGISEALLTTQFGLAIAIPAFLAQALLSRGARRILASAEQTVLWYLHGAGVLIEPAGEHRHSGAHAILVDTSSTSTPVHHHD